MVDVSTLHRSVFSVASWVLVISSSIACVLVLRCQFIIASVIIGLCSGYCWVTILPWTVVSMMLWFVINYSRVLLQLRLVLTGSTGGGPFVGFTQHGSYLNLWDFPVVYF